MNKMLRKNRLNWRGACILWTVSSALLLISVLMLNLIVDPYNLTLWITSSSINAVVPDLFLQSRWSKAAGLIRVHPNVLLLGTSVVDHGFQVPGSTEYDSLR